MSNTESLHTLERPLANLLIHQDEQAFYREGLAEIKLLGKAYEHIELLLKQMYLAMPLARNNWQVLKPETLSRNSVCPCGSGKKLKKCCSFLLDVPPPPSDLLFQVALNAMSVDQLATLANQQPPMANQWLEIFSYVADECEAWPVFLSASQHLLEKPETLRNEDVFLFSQILDAMVHCGQEGQRRAVAESFSKHAKSKAIRSSAHQRLAMMDAQDGHEQDAKEHLRLAIQLYPKHEELPFAELSILGLIADDSELKMRARFWQKQLLKSYEPDAPIFDLIDDILTRGKQVFEEMQAPDYLDEAENSASGAYASADFSAELSDSLLTLFQQTELEFAYKLNIKEGVARCSLKPGLRKLVQAWQATWLDNADETKAVFEVVKEDDIAGCRWYCVNLEWLDLLQRHPELLNTHEVLRELSLFIALDPNDDSELDEAPELWQAYEARLVFTTLKFIELHVPKGVELPARFKANALLWEQGKQALISLNQYLDSEELVQQYVLQLSELDPQRPSWLNDYRLKHLLYAQDYASYLRYYESCRNVTLGASLMYAAALQKNGQTSQALKHLIWLTGRLSKQLNAFKRALETKNQELLVKQGEGLLSWYYLLVQNEQLRSEKDWLIRQLP